MKNIDFSKHTQNFKSDDPEIKNLSVLTTTYGDESHGMTSCWHLSFFEAVKLLFTRKVYAQLLGKRHPPILLAVHRQDVLIDETELFYEENPEDCPKREEMVFYQQFSLKEINMVSPEIY